MIVAHGCATLVLLMANVLAVPTGERRSDGLRSTVPSGRHFSRGRMQIALSLLLALRYYATIEVTLL